MNPHPRHHTQQLINFTIGDEMTAMGYCALVTPTVELIAGKKPTTFDEYLQSKKEELLAVLSN